MLCLWQAPQVITGEPCFDFSGGGQDFRSEFKKGASVIIRGSFVSRFFAPFFAPAELAPPSNLCPSTLTRDLPLAQLNGFRPDQKAEIVRAIQRAVWDGAGAQGQRQEGRAAVQRHLRPAAGVSGL